MRKLVKQDRRKNNEAAEVMRQKDCDEAAQIRTDRESVMMNSGAIQSDSDNADSEDL